MRMPRWRSSRSLSITPGTSCSSTFSVISISSASRGRPCRATISDTRCTRSGRLNSCGETLTATRSCVLPAACQSDSWRHASSITQALIAPIRPVSSARSMKAPGCIRPCCGWRQRINASAPTTRPRRRLYCGWKCSTNSSLGNARRRSRSSSRRGRKPVRISAEKARAAFLPLALTSYIAVSALCSSCSEASPSSGQTAMPMLAVAKNSRPATWNGRRSPAEILSAIAIASVAVPRPGSSTVNSSPPWRATVSPARTQSRMRCAHWRSSSSPSRWP